MKYLASNNDPKGRFVALDPCILPSGGVAPFSIQSWTSDASTYSRTVYITGDNALRLGDILWCCEGNEPAKGGYRSGVTRGKTRYTEVACRNVLIDGRAAAHHQAIGEINNACPDTVTCQCDSNQTARTSSLSEELKAIETWIQWRELMLFGKGESLLTVVKAGMDERGALREALPDIPYRGTQHIPQYLRDVERRARILEKMRAIERLYSERFRPASGTLRHKPREISQRLQDSNPHAYNLSPSLFEEGSPLDRTFQNHIQNQNVRFEDDVTTARRAQLLLDASIVAWGTAGALKNQLRPPGIARDGYPMGPTVTTRQIRPGTAPVPRTGSPRPGDPQLEILLRPREHGGLPSRSGPTLGGSKTSNVHLVPGRPGAQICPVKPKGVWFEGEDLKPPPAHLKLKRPVIYLDDVRPYRITVKNGILYDADGKLFDTGGGQAIVVMDRFGAFYAHKNPVIGRMHHSSLLRGGGASWAGEWQARAGRITMMNSRSGHYRPTELHEETVLQRLREHGVDTNEFPVNLW